MGEEDAQADAEQLRLLGGMPSGDGEGQARMEKEKSWGTEVEEEVEAAAAVQLSVTREMLLRGLMIACE